ncbi:tripartite tricarboxylate transporter permease [Geminicoccaceae bacterium 1502E]|nr:tripartite tricarboxylate transporter permease [Geminicoccaceae bacterium 1502E]
MGVLAHFSDALTPFHLLLALAGVVAGTVVGALPGLTATMAVAVLTPLTFGMPPQSALILLGAIYTGAIYGGCYAAILVNTPGTPSAIATTFDGWPMARRGDGDLALTIAVLASVTGGVVGVLLLLLLAPPLAQVALAFGPVEYFWLAVLGLTLISAISEASLLKGVLGCAIGLMISMVGTAIVGGDIRFTFESQALLGGVNLVAALVGIFCIPVVMDLVATPDAHLKVGQRLRGFRLAEAAGHAWTGRWNLLRSSVIGTLVGILPGAGGSIASLVAYAEARRTAREPASYGHGAPGGILASESANNATVGGGFVPTLVLGIPGTPPDAIILGALLVHGIRTGPNLFSAQSGIVYTFIFGLLVATLIMLPAGLLLGRYAFRTIIRVPKAVLAPAILLMTLIGTFAINNNIHDVWVMLALGAGAWLLGRAGITPAPVVLGVVLGPIAEQGFVQGWLIGSATGNVAGEFFGRPIALAIIGMILLTLLWPLIARRLQERREEQP